MTDLTPEQKRAAIDFLATQYESGSDDLAAAQGMCNGFAASIVGLSLIALATVVALELLP